MARRPIVTEGLEKGVSSISTFPPFRTAVGLCGASPIVLFHMADILISKCLLFASLKPFKKECDLAAGLVWTAFKDSNMSTVRLRKAC